jgi:hypothetical protein
MKRLELKRYGAKLRLELASDCVCDDDQDDVWVLAFVCECEDELTAQITEVYARKMLAKALRGEKP